jgi:hypothetical protein
MRNVIFKTGEADAIKSGAMEADTISKTGQDMQSRKSRKNNNKNYL